METSVNRKQIITRFDKKIVCALLEDNEIVQIDCEKENQVSILQNIYIGKVTNIVENIQAAFIEIADGQICYYSLAENNRPFFTDKLSKKETVSVGDELLVQVSKEAVKTKSPVVTSKLTMVGRNVIVNTQNESSFYDEPLKSNVFVSNKWSDGNNKNKIKAAIEDKLHLENIIGYNCILRTNAQHTSKNQIFSEIKFLISKLEDIKKISKNRTCYSCVYMSPAPYIQTIEENNSNEIITDCEDLYDLLVQYFSSKNEIAETKIRSVFARGADALYAKEHVTNELSIKYYDDKLLPLKKLYSIENVVDKAFKEQVWLASGGYLVIQPTEALTVIDVNTGKAIAGKNDMENNFLKINLEAAKEAMKQIRLRNISGIIIIDFISLKNFENKEILIDSLKELCKLDTVKTTVVDITKLDLVEITRKKVKKTLYKQWH